MMAQKLNGDTIVRFHEKTKKGLNFAALPALGYDSDLGFNYGIVGNVYHYGDGSIYPRYKHSLFFEFSRYTKGSTKSTICYDSEYLIPKIRVTIQANRTNEQAANFFGFNGYNAYYNPDFENKNSTSYISKMYYRYDRKQTQIDLGLQGNVIDRKLRWLGGFTYFKTNIKTVNVDRLNRGRKSTDKLPDTLLLYDKFIGWGVIPYNQKNGGITNLLRLGLVYDTRDNEPNPMKGLWSEMMIVAAPPLIGNKFAYARLVITHRQYFTLVKKVLNVAYRLSYQGKIAGNMPFYMLPYAINSDAFRDGLGGSRTIRGVLRNRVVGQDFVYGNVEMRWKCLYMYIFKQNIYFALTGFTDFGRITRKYKYDTTNPDAIDYLSKGSAETWHSSYGVGFYGAMNQNFVGGLTYGVATNPKDGKNGIYIVLDFLF
jgi:outer membrane protein assembly factor BamA